jgi:hypothetical protein
MSTAEACTVDTGKATFSAGQVGLVVASSATDIFTITGAAGRKIKVLRIEVSGIATAAGTQPYSVVKRTTANTGGTSAALSAVAHEAPVFAPWSATKAYLVGDSATSSGISYACILANTNNVPPNATYWAAMGRIAAATVLTYTANPTVGALTGQGGVMAAKRGTLLTAAAASAASPTVFDFTTTGSKYPTLNSENDVLALNFNGATAAGNALDVFATWTEE